MGTALTGLEIKDTYDGLVKTTDNGPLTGSLKKLTDGLGNDSSLSLSTTAASLSGTLAVTGNATFDTNTLFVDAANNAVGIGTITPSDGLVGGLVIGNGTDNKGITLFGTATTQQNIAFTDTANLQQGLIQYDHATDYMRFFTATSERLRITSAGNVGIGTSAPAERLQVFGNQRFVGNNIATSNTLISQINAYAGTSNQFLSSSIKFLTGTFVDEGRITFNTSFSGVDVERARIDSDGLKFNGDTAAANALDDYEEGTWTMGVSFGGASVGVTTSSNTGTYVKIGRQVTVNGYIVLTSKGSSTGIAFLTGLPFNAGNTSGNFGAASLWFNNISFLNQFQGRVNQNLNYIELEEITTLGVASNLTNADFANNSGIMISATYQV